MCLSKQAFIHMKMVRFWFLMMVAHAMFILLGVTGSSDHELDVDKFSSISEDSATATTPNGELMKGSSTQRKINNDDMKLDDYRPIDPVPGSSAAVTRRPIEHGTPLLPYIPKVAPPSPYVASPFPPPVS